MERANLATYNRPLLYFFSHLWTTIASHLNMGDGKGKGWREKPRAEFIKLEIKLEITPQKRKKGNFGFWYSCYLDRLEKHQVLL